MNYYVDNLNYIEPYQPYINQNVALLSSEFFMRTYFYLKKSSYISDNGLFLNSNNNYGEILNYSQDRIFDNRNLTLNGGKLFYQLTYSLNSDGMEEIYNRSYKKIQNVMADVGGFLNSLRLIVSLILYGYYEISFTTTMFKKYIILYNLKKEKSQK